MMNISKKFMEILVNFQFQKYHKTLNEAEYAFICSGTATLESAIIGTPFTFIYCKKLIFLLEIYVCKIKLCWTYKYFL